MVDNGQALLLTVAEAAKLLQISPNTAYELIRQKRIPLWLANVEVRYQ